MTGCHCHCRRHLLQHRHASPPPSSPLQLFFVPIYLSSLFMWPIVHFADEPYLGRKQRLNRRRSHQGSLLMLEALHYIREAFPLWNASAGTDSSAAVAPINVLVSAALSLIRAVTGAVAVQPKRAMQEAAYVVSYGVQDRGVAMMLPKAMSADHWTQQCRALWPVCAAMIGKVG